MQYYKKNSTFASVIIIYPMISEMQDHEASLSDIHDGYAMSILLALSTFGVYPEYVGIIPSSACLMSWRCSPMSCNVASQTGLK